MLNSSLFNDIPSEGLFFMSLGGIGEIGANCYLYGSDGKWLMIDLGITFADEKFPGVDLLLPKLDFINDLSGAYFQVQNPNASVSCGCGTSFSI